MNKRQQSQKPTSKPKPAKEFVGRKLVGNPAQRNILRAAEARDFSMVYGNTSTGNAVHLPTSIFSDPGVRSLDLDKTRKIIDSLPKNELKLKVEDIDYIVAGKYTKQLRKSERTQPGNALMRIILDEASEDRLRNEIGEVRGVFGIPYSDTAQDNAGVIEIAHLTGDRDQLRMHQTRRAFLDAASHLVDKQVTLGNLGVHRI